MRTFENIVRILIASVFGTLVTALEGNETSINAMDAPGKSDSDPYDEN